VDEDDVLKRIEVNLSSRESILYCQPCFFQPSHGNRSEHAHGRHPTCVGTIRSIGACLAKSRDYSISARSATLDNDPRALETLEIDLVIMLCHSTKMSHADSHNTSTQFKKIGTPVYCPSLRFVGSLYTCCGTNYENHARIKKVY